MLKVDVLDRPSAAKLSVTTRAEMIGRAGRSPMRLAVCSRLLVALVPESAHVPHPDGFAFGVEIVERLARFRLARVDERLSRTASAWQVNLVNLPPAALETLQENLVALDAFTVNLADEHPRLPEVAVLPSRLHDTTLSHACTKRARLTLRHRFDYCPPRRPERAAELEAVRASCGQLAALDVVLPDGREKDLALAKIEEATFWANAAVAWRRQLAFDRRAWRHAHTGL